MATVCPILAPAAAAALLLAASLAAAEPAPPPIVIDPLPLRALLAERDFDALEARFAAARAGRDSHETTVLLFALDDLGAEQHAALEEWASTRSDSMAAQLALAQRELARAWEARGTGAARTVGRDAWRLMHARLERALALAAEAAGRDPRWLDARRIQIEGAQLLADRALAQRAFEAALAVDPTHYGVWWAYQNSFHRNWGGSHEAQEEIARAAQAHASANPRLRRLLGAVDYDRAMGLWSAGRAAEALAGLDRVLTNGDGGKLRAQRAALRVALGDPQGARAEIEAGLAVDPHSADIQAELAVRCMHEHDFACMVDAAARAAALEPGNAKHRDTHAWATWAVEHPSAAIQQLGRHPVQDLLHRNSRAIYLHAFRSAVFAALVGASWYAWRARRRRRDEANAAAPITRAPASPLAPPTTPRSMVECLPRTGVLMVRAFVWFSVVAHLLHYSEIMHPAAMRPFLVVYVAITAVALAGALGFAHGIRLGRAWIWKLFAPLFPLWKLAAHHETVSLEQWPIWSFFHLQLLPIYLALFLYGYACDALWRGGLPGPGWASERSRGAMAARRVRG